MGRSRNWFATVKRVFSRRSKHKKYRKSKSTLDATCNPPPDVLGTTPLPVLDAPLKAPSPPPEEVFNAPLKTPSPPHKIMDGPLKVPSSPPEVSEVEEEVKVNEYVNEQNDSVNPSIEIASDAGVEVSVVSEPVTPVVIQPVVSRFAGKSREEIAAIMIQSAFRGYMGRKTIRIVKRLARLKSLMQGNSVKRQSASTLRCMQMLSRVHTQIRSGRISITEENQALQRQLQLKREKELEALKASSLGGEWNDSLQSREKIEASLISKHEAALKRERALAYAYSHQWKGSRSVNPLFMNPNNPSWGWSWIERWTASRSRDSCSLSTKELVSGNASETKGQVLKAHSIRETEKHSPGEQKTSQPVNKQSSARHVSPMVRRPVSPNSKGKWTPSDEYTRSPVAIHSERNKKQGMRIITRDDGSQASSSTVPGYMTPTESAKAKSRLQSPSRDHVELPEKKSPGPTKKRQSFPGAEKLGLSPPSRERHLSGPPNMNLGNAAIGNGGG